MSTLTSEQIIEQVSHFAAEHIACHHNLSSGENFPHNLWGGMAQDGLFKIGIDESYGGSGGGYLNLSEVAEALVKNGNNIGIATSWLYQQIIARFLIAGFGNTEQKRQYLPEMARGALIASFAVSEPKRGAHPKYITTSAVKDGSFYTLTGEKTYLTNAPIAQLYIVIAVTAEGQQRRFTAFLVPRQQEGLQVGPPLNLNILKPSPHGSIALNQCRLQDTAILGKEGTAYREMVIPFGEIEDIIMMGATAGAMAAELSLLIRTIRESSIVANELLRIKLGAQDAALQTIRAISSTAARKLDQGEVPSATVPLAIVFMNLIEEFQANMDTIIKEWHLHINGAYNCLRIDLIAMMALKKKITLLRQEKLGLELLKERGEKECFGGKK